MKAVEWAAKFEAIPVSDAPPMERFADVLKEFGVETAELVAARTKGSKQGAELPAADGAVREQKSKFRAICGRVPALTEAMFDLLLATAVPNFAVWQAAAQKKKVEKQPEDDVKNYRNKYGKHHHKKEGSHGKGRKDQVHSGGNPGVRT